MDRHQLMLKKILNGINAWMITGMIVLIFILIASINWAYSDPNVISWILMILGITGVLGWWAWSMIIIYLLIMQRIRERHLIKNVVNEIKEIKADIKNKLFK